MKRLRLGRSIATLVEKTMRIKTENIKGRVHTVSHNNRWYSIAIYVSSSNVHASNKKTLEAASLFEAGQNHLELCKGLL